MVKPKNDTKQVADRLLSVLKKLRRTLKHHELSEDFLFEAEEITLKARVDAMRS